MQARLSFSLSYDILKARTVSTLQGLLISCNQMSAEYLFMTDKLYDVRYDTGDKVIQCGRHNDIFKLWLQWRAKVLKSAYIVKGCLYAFLVTHRASAILLSSDVIVPRWFIIKFSFGRIYLFLCTRAQKASRDTWIDWWSWRSTWLEGSNKCPTSTIWSSSPNWWTSASGICPRACETCRTPRRE